MTARSTLDFRFHFNQLLKDFPMCTSYEPELFPAIYWREGKICLMCYPNGSLVITGATNFKQIVDIATYFEAAAIQYKRSTSQ